MGATGANASDTLSASDVLAGGAGTDTLNLTVTDTNTAALNAATITGIEVINVRTAVAGKTATIDASTAVGATQVNANQGPGAVTVTGLSKGSAIGVIGNGTVTNGTTTFSYSTATFDQTINIANGVLGGNITAGASTGVTKATINSTGAANTVGTVDLDSAASTVTSLTINAATDLTATLAADYANTAALVVTGAGKVDVGSAGTFKTVDASANTGGLTMAIDTVTTSFKGSAANDTITTVTLAATAAGAIDAGAGTGDKLVVAAAADVATAALRGSYTNFEVLANSAGASITASDFTGITSVESSAATGGFTGLTAGQAANIAVSASQTAGVTYALTDATGKADVIGLTLGTGKTTAAATSVTGAALVVTGFETLNLIANPGATATVGANKTSTIASLTGATLAAVNMSGTAVTITDAATTVATKFDASALTGDGTVAGANGLNIAGNLVVGSSVTGSAFIDTVALGTVGSTYSLGDGKDAVSGTVAQLRSATVYNTIDGGAGVDTLTINNGTNTAVTIVDADLSKVTNVEKITVATSGTAAQSIATGGFFDQNFKAAGVEWTTTSSTGAIALDVSTFTGTTKVTSTSTTGAQTITGSLTGATTVDATLTTGAATVTTGAGNDTVKVTHSDDQAADVVTTGAGDDAITLVAAAGKTVATTITGGKGADTIVLDTLGTSTDTIVIGNTDSGITLATADKITNFLAASDALKLGTAGDASTAGAINYHEAAAAVAGFDAALAAANTQLAAMATANTGDVEAYQFQWDATNGYLFNDTDGNGTADQVIVLVGITGATISVADTIA